MRRLLYIVFLVVLALCGYKLWNDTRKPDTSNFGVEAAETNTINVDFARQIATGSPLIFGGVHSPSVTQSDAWDLLSNVGVTLLRQDFYMDEALPKNITLDDYRNNKNNVQDPKNWNWTHGWSNMNNTESIYLNAQNKGIKVMGIVTYAPAWLTYNNNPHGVPKDWNVYEDIVKKTYKIYRPFLNYVEIWNEPNYKYFLIVSGSNLTEHEAYLQIFKHAAKAIREVDTSAGDGKFIPIGGPVSYQSTDPADLATLLGDSEASKYLGFVSYHNYSNPEPSWDKFKAILTQFHKEYLPIFITEWMNFPADGSSSMPYATTDLAISYAGGKLVDFLKMGLSGANYYNLAENQPARKGTEFSDFGFYQIKNGKAVALPQTKTWRLLSKSLGLGAGASKVVNAISNSDLNSTAFINSLNQRGVAAVNSTNNLELVQVNASNVNIFGKATVKIFEASVDEDGGSPTCTNEINVSNRTMSFKILVPPQSAVGMLITPPELSFARIMRVLGANTSSNCIAQ